jgi:hypothetical protein
MEIRTLFPKQVIVSSNSSIPPNILKLFLEDFNELVDNLPITLTQLSTGDNFNQPVDHLPPSSNSCFWL